MNCEGSPQDAKTQDALRVEIGSILQQSRRGGGTKTTGLDGSGAWTFKSGDSGRSGLVDWWID